MGDFEPKAPMPSMPPNPATADLRRDQAHYQDSDDRGLHPFRPLIGLVMRRALNDMKNKLEKIQSKEVVPFVKITEINMARRLAGTPSHPMTREPFTREHAFKSLGYPGDTRNNSDAYAATLYAQDLLLDEGVLGEEVLPPGSEFVPQLRIIDPVKIVEISNRDFQQDKSLAQEFSRLDEVGRDALVADIISKHV